MSGPILSTARPLWCEQMDGFSYAYIQPYSTIEQCLLAPWKVCKHFWVRRKLIFYRPSPNYCKCLFQGLDMIYSSQFSKWFHWHPKKYKQPSWNDNHHPQKMNENLKIPTSYPTVSPSFGRNNEITSSFFTVSCFVPIWKRCASASDRVAIGTKGLCSNNKALETCQASEGQVPWKIKGVSVFSLNMAAKESNNQI